MQTVSLIPPPLEGIPTGDEFISRLLHFDTEFDEKRRQASKQDKVLRFVGVVDVENGDVKAALEEYASDRHFL